jgi:hypothetical protein
MVSCLLSNCIIKVIPSDYSDVPALKIKTASTPQTPLGVTICTPAAVNNLHFLIDNLPLSQFEAHLNLHGMSYEGPFMKLLSTPHALLLEIVIIFLVRFSPQRVFSGFLLTYALQRIFVLSLSAPFFLPQRASSCSPVSYLILHFQQSH